MKWIFYCIAHTERVLCVALEMIPNLPGILKGAKEKSKSFKMCYNYYNIDFQRGLNDFGKC